MFGAYLVKIGSVAKKLELAMDKRHAHIYKNPLFGFRESKMAIFINFITVTILSLFYSIGEKVKLNRLKRLFRS